MFYVEYFWLFSNNLYSFHSREFGLVSFCSQYFAILYVKILGESVDHNDCAGTANLPANLRNFLCFITLKSDRASRVFTNSVWHDHIAGALFWVHSSFSPSSTHFAVNHPPPSLPLPLFCTLSLSLTPAPSHPLNFAPFLCFSILKENGCGSGSG